MDGVIHVGAATGFHFEGGCVVERANLCVRVYTRNPAARDSSSKSRSMIRLHKPAAWRTVSVTRFCRSARALLSLLFRSRLFSRTTFNSYCIVRSLIILLHSIKVTAKVIQRGPDSEQ